PRLVCSTTIGTNAICLFSSGRFFRNLIFHYFAGMLEQEIERLLRLDVRRDAVERPILLHAEPHGRQGLALLLGDPLDLAVHLIAGCGDGARSWRSPSCCLAMTT